MNIEDETTDHTGRIMDAVLWTVSAEIFKQVHPNLRHNFGSDSAVEFHFPRKCSNEFIA